MLNDARRELAYADHLFRVTFPLVKEKRVYSNIINHLYNAFMISIKELLKNEKIKKKIRIFPATDELAISIFEDEFENIIDDKKTFKEFIMIAEANKERYDEIMRDDSLVIMLKNFKMVKIDGEDIEKYILMVKHLISRIEGEINGL